MIVILVQNNACNLKAVRLAQQACYERQVGGSWCLKVDISNYFNSIDVARLLPRLTFLQEENEALYGQLTALGLTVNPDKVSITNPLRKAKAKSGERVRLCGAGSGERDCPRTRWPLRWPAP